MGDKQKVKAEPNESGFQAPLTEQERLQLAWNEIQQVFAKYGVELRAVSQLTIEGQNVVVAHPMAQLVIRQQP